MDNFDDFYTIEIKTEKAWEVVYTTTKMNDAIRRFKSEESNLPWLPVRLTTPMVETR